MRSAPLIAKARAISRLPILPVRASGSRARARESQECLRATASAPDAFVVCHVVSFFASAPDRHAFADGLAGISSITRAWPSSLRSVLLSGAFCRLAGCLGRGLLGCGAFAAAGFFAGALVAALRVPPSPLPALCARLAAASCGLRALSSLPVRRRFSSIRRIASSSVIVSGERSSFKVALTLPWLT